MLPPAARQQRPQLKGEPLKRSLLLAGLLHVWLAVLVGTAPGDARQDEQAGGGRLTVHLQGAGQPGGAPDTQADRGPVGEAASRRFGGVVRREDEEAPPDRPGAAREGDWAPRPSSIKQLQDQSSSQSGALQAPSAIAPISPISLAHTEALRSELPAPPLETDPRVIRQLDSTAQATAQVQQAQVEPLSRPVESPQPLARVELPAQSTARLDVPVSPARVEAPQRLERLAAPRPAELGSLPTLEAPAPRLSTLPTPAQAQAQVRPIQAQELHSLNTLPSALAANPKLSLPEQSTARLRTEGAHPAEKIQASALAPLAAQRDAQVQDLSASPRLSPSEHALARLPDPSASSAARMSLPTPLSGLKPSSAEETRLQGLPPLSAPVDQQGEGRAKAASAADPAADSAAAGSSASSSAGAAARPAVSTNTGAAATGPTSLPSSERSLTGGTNQGAAIAARPGSSLGKVSLTGADPGQGPAALPQPGSPDAGAQRGRDVATAPSAPASAPRLNLNLPTSQRGPVASSRSRALLEIAPNPPELKTKLQKEMEQALREDCRKAYAENGLLALGAIALDALRAKGCKF